MTTDTQELKKVSQDIRDRPARRLISSGAAVMCLSALAAAVLLAQALVLHSLAALAVLIAGSVLLVGGQIIRHRRTGQDAVEEQLRREIRDARPADTQALGQIAAQLEALAASIPEALREAHANGYVKGVNQRLNGSTGTVVPFERA